MKRPFVTKEQAEAIAARYPTPFHIYDEGGIRANARRLYRAFAWDPGFREYFAVKATPTPGILKLLKEEGCGVDCSSLTELMMAQRCGFRGEEIMFSSNDTPAEEFALAARLGAVINLDDISHIDALLAAAGSVPRKICCRNRASGLVMSYPQKGVVSAPASTVITWPTGPQLIGSQMATVPRSPTVRPSPWVEVKRMYTPGRTLF